ncbi:MAG TPA: hypothetical protein DDZ51_20325 [Planctomycetaceae bacterium]|nr:hypothetical protein [Planctomycetaceae bacterium]
MKTAYLRHFLPCLAALVAVVGTVRPAPAENSTAQLLINQWIRQAEDGSIRGKIVLPQKDGTVVAVTTAVVGLADTKGASRTEKVDENGEFTFTDVEPGVYTLVTRGAKDVCAIVALHVMAHDNEKAAGLASSIEVSAGRVDFTSVNANLIRYLPPQKDEDNRDSTAGIDFSILSAQLASETVRRVKQTDGGMSGQIYAAGAVGAKFAPSQDTNIFLYQDGIEIERLTTDTNGSFEFELLEPGVYSLMAIGGSGAGLVGFELVGENTPSFAADNSSATLVSTLQDPIASQFVLQVGGGGLPGGGLLGLAGLAGVAAVTIQSDVLIDEQVISEEIIDEGYVAPMGGGGYASAGGGGPMGGGAAGGGGSMLGFATIGGALAAVIAASNNDNDRVIIPPPATPAIP